MVSLSNDPLAGGIADYARRLRKREITAEQAVEIYLARIQALNGALTSYEHVAAEQARGQAKAIDQLLRAGVDHGPLMGVPISIKDIFAVDGTPTRAGSNADVADIIGAEGPFIKLLKRAGCIILGKAHTV